MAFANFLLELATFFRNQLHFHRFFYVLTALAAFLLNLISESTELIHSSNQISGPISMVSREPRDPIPGIEIEVDRTLSPKTGI